MSCEIEPADLSRKLASILALEMYKAHGINRNLKPVMFATVYFYEHAIGVDIKTRETLVLTLYEACKNIPRIVRLKNAFKFGVQSCALEILNKNVITCPPSSSPIPTPSST